MVDVPPEGRQGRYLREVRRRYAVVQPPKYTNGWNYDKIAPASGRELPEGELHPMREARSCPRIRAICRQFQRILKNPLTGNGDLLNY